MSPQKAQDIQSTGGNAVNQSAITASTAVGGASVQGQSFGVGFMPPNAYQSENSAAIRYNQRQQQILMAQQQQ